MRLTVSTSGERRVGRAALLLLAVARVQRGVRRAQLVAAAHVGRSHLPHRQRRPLRLARAHPGGGAVCKRRRSRPATAARTAPRRRHTAPSAAARARPAPRRTRGIGARPAMPCFVLYSSRERHASRCDCDEKLDTLCIGRCGRHLGSSAAWHSTHACRSDRSAQQAAHSSVCRGSCASCTCVTVRTSVLPAAPPRGRAAWEEDGRTGAGSRVRWREVARGVARWGRENRSRCGHMPARRVNTSCDDAQIPKYSPSFVACGTKPARGGAPRGI